MHSLALLMLLHARPATLVIDVSPNDAKVFVDGKRCKTTSLMLPPGAHTIRVTSAGAVREERIDLVADEHRVWLWDFDAGRNEGLVLLKPSTRRSWATSASSTRSQATQSASASSLRRAPTAAEGRLPTRPGWPAVSSRFASSSTPTRHDRRSLRTLEA